MTHDLRRHSSGQAGARESVLLGVCILLASLAPDLRTTSSAVVRRCKKEEHPGPPELVWYYELALASLWADLES